MKKLIFALLFAFSTVAAFAYDYREVIFGNDFEKIKESSDKAALNFFLSQKSIKNAIYGDIKSARLFEEKYENGTIYRLLMSYETLSDENLAKWFETKNILLQTVFIKINGGYRSVSAQDIYHLHCGDGTVRSWEEDNFGGVSVLSRNNRIVGLLEFNNAERVVEGFDEESGKSSTSTERKTSGTLYYWKDLLNEAFYRTIEGDDFLRLDAWRSDIPKIPIYYSYPLIEKSRPFKYTIQNAFDGNPATSYVEDTEDNKFEISISAGSQCKKIKIINGYAQSESLYKSNNRIQSIYGTETGKVSNLKDDTLKPQVLDWAEFGFSVKEIFKGQKYNDTCVAELDFLCEDGSWLFGE